MNCDSAKDLSPSFVRFLVGSWILDLLEDLALWWEELLAAEAAATSTAAVPRPPRFPASLGTQRQAGVSGMVGLLTICVHLGAVTVTVVATGHLESSGVVCR